MQMQLCVVMGAVSYGCWSLTDV